MRAMMTAVILGLSLAASPVMAAEIRGLPIEEVQNLRAGNGMGLAQAAELAGYPGPRHVLDLVDAGRAHLRTHALLDAPQLARYAELRGQASPPSHH